MKGRIQQWLLSPATIWVCPQRRCDQKDCSRPMSISLWSCALGYCRRQLSFSSSWIRTFHPSAHDVGQLFNGAQQGGLAIPRPCFQGVDRPSRFPGRVPCCAPPGCPCHIPGTPLPALSTDRPKAAMGLSTGDWPAILPPFPAHPHQWSDSVWERWNCRTGHWRTTSQGWTFQDWTMTDKCVGS